MTTDSIERAARRLLGAAEGAIAFQPLSGGANNRVFRVIAGNRRTILKAYLQHPGDTRDRLRSEYAFASFCWDHGVSTGPQPVAVDWEDRVALYEEIEGTHIQPGAVTREHVAQAGAFVQAINVHRASDAAAALGPASEAHFSVEAHLRGIDARVGRLRSIDREDPIDHDAAAFIASSLLPAWDRVHRHARARVSELGLHLERELPTEERRLSPSDFGFHNALVEASGRVRFIDFEYAGWDDPAKLVCDFFCQEAVPVPESHLEAFVARVLDEGGASGQRGRVEVLLPAYKIKWCCIMLNEFLPLGASRRRFTGREDDRLQRKSRQLAKARAALHQ